MLQIRERSAARADLIQSLNARMNGLLKDRMQPQNGRQSMQELVDLQKAEITSLSSDLAVLCTIRD